MKRIHFDHFIALAIAVGIARVVAGAILPTDASLAAEQVSTAGDTSQPERNSLGMQFVKISPGVFLMGAVEKDRETDADERPQRRVAIEQEFWLGAHELTQAQYEAVMGENPSWFAPGGGGAAYIAALDHRQLPVDMLSWHDAGEFCRRLSALPAELMAGRRYRLPTEAEWEYACRAGTETRFNLGSRLTAKDACLIVDGSVPSTTRPVGSFQPNDWGLFDMHGNVWEWCQDAYRFDAYQQPADRSVAAAEPGTGHVVRGGDWRSTPHAARSSNRDFTRATRRDLGNGLRVVMERKETTN